MHRAMPTLCLLTPGLRAGLVSERLRIETPPSENRSASVRDLPLTDIERVVVSEHCSLSLSALAEFLRRQIPVIVTSGAERVLGACMAPAPHSASRLAQYQRSGNPEAALPLAIRLVGAKITNARRVLQRLASNRPDSHVEPALRALANLAGDCARCASLDSLRGYEGAASAKYFEVYGSFFPENCPFEHRSRRPPHNPPNAILSYTYTLLCAEAETAIHAAGLDPALGLLHCTEDRRPSLALDLIEPFRAPFADALALDLLSHGTLHPTKHFEPANGGIYLNSEGKKRFFVAYERRIEREFTSEAYGRRTSLRREIEAEVASLKKHFRDETPFEPFLMN